MVYLSTNSHVRKVVCLLFLGLSGGLAFAQPVIMDVVKGVVFLDINPMDGQFAPETGYDPHPLQRPSEGNLGLEIEVERWKKNAAGVFVFDGFTATAQLVANQGYQYDVPILRGSEYQLRYLNTDDAIFSESDNVYNFYPTVRHASGTRKRDSQVFARRATPTSLPEFWSERFKTTVDYPLPASAAPKTIHVNAGFYRTEPECADIFPPDPGTWANNKIPMSGKICRACDNVVTDGFRVEFNREITPKFPGGPGGTNIDWQGDLVINHLNEPNIVAYPSDIGPNGVANTIFMTANIPFVNEPTFGGGCVAGKSFLVQPFAGFNFNDPPNANFVKVMLCESQPRKEACRIQVYVPAFCNATDVDEYANDPVVSQVTHEGGDDRNGNQENAPTLAAKAEELVIYPNPVGHFYGEKLTILLPENAENTGWLTIFDAQARPVQTVNLEDETPGSLVVDIENLTTGHYFARLVQANRRPTIKAFVVQR